MCRWCKELNKEDAMINITQVFVGMSYCSFHCPIMYCPVCGKVLDRYKEKNYKVTSNGDIVKK